MSILVPIDFSSSSIQTLKYAASLAAEKKMILNLLYCYPERDYERKYDFGKADYEEGIKTMLKEWYERHISHVEVDTRYLASKGSLAEQITKLSSKFDLIVLKAKNTPQRLSHWLKDWVASIVSDSNCPVLLLPPDIRYRSWTKIWHIKRQESEDAILARVLPSLLVEPTKVEVKSLQQKTFKSNTWKLIVQYFEHPSKKLHRSIIDHSPPKSVELLILVSHRKSSFTKFLHNEAIQIIFRLSVPVLICQANSDVS